MELAIGRRGGLVMHLSRQNDKGGMMKVNAELMAKARFEKRTIGSLTVKEFRQLINECIESERFERERRESEVKVQTARWK